MPQSDVRCIVLAAGRLLMVRTPEGAFAFPRIPVSGDDAFAGFTAWSERTLGVPLERRISFEDGGLCVMAVMDGPPVPAPGLEWVDFHRYGDMAPSARQALGRMYRAVPPGCSFPGAPAIWRIYVRGGADRERAIREWLAAAARERADAAATGRSRWTVLLCALALAVLFDALFVKLDPGASAPLFTGLFIAVAAVLFRGQPGMGRPLPWALGGSALLLSAGWALHNDGFLLAVDTLAAPLLLAAMLRTWAWDGGWTLPGLLAASLERALVDPPRHFHRLFPLLRALLRGRNGRTRRMNRGVVIGVLTAVPLFVLVAALLVSSDLVMARLLEGWLDWLTRIRLGDIPRHVFVSFLCLLFFFGLLWSQRYIAGLPPPAGTRSKARIQPVTGIIVLSPALALYALFIVIQFAYLFTGGGHLPHSLTFAQYAHRGFAQLVAVSVINMALILLFVRFSELRRGGAARGLRVLTTLVVPCTLVILASALYRMIQYIGAYGYTWLRINVVVFIFMLAVMQCALALRVHCPRVPICRTLAAVAILFYLGLNMTSVDRCAAAGNIDRYFASGDAAALDAGYIADELGCDAAGEVLRLLDSADPDIAAAVDAYMERNRASARSASGSQWNLGRARFESAYAQWARSRNR